MKDVTELLKKRYPITYFETYNEEIFEIREVEDDGFIHIQRGKYRYVFYKEPQGSLTWKDIPRFAKGVNKALRKVEE